MKNQVYRQIATSFQALLNCEKSGNAEWLHNHRENIEFIVKNFLPSGSGIDHGIKFDFESSKLDKLIFTFEYHHMNENGCYDGWTSHKLILSPRLQSDFNMKITGKDRNSVKDYLYDVFHGDLSQYIEYSINKQENGNYQFELSK